MELSEIYGFNLVRRLGHNALDFIVQQLTSRLSVGVNAIVSDNAILVFILALLGTNLLRACADFMKVVSSLIDRVVLLPIALVLGDLLYMCVSAPMSTTFVERCTRLYFRFGSYGRILWILPPDMLLFDLH